MPNYNYIDLNYLDSITDGDLEMKTTLLQLIIDDIENDFVKIDDYANNQDWDNLSSVSHKMKSTLGYVGNQEISDANAQIESITRYGGNLDDIPNYVNVLNNLKDSVLYELKEALKELS